ncbi:MAG: indole-3-glycerol-phosphate synthase [Deltaproteobacteria bacterium]|nr:indole-3-glycerol-phosphate synthase [Deltaproteobacteria bacterium]
MTKNGKNLLDSIVAAKRLEVAERVRTRSRQERAALERAAADAGQGRSLRGALTSSSSPRIIAEFKRRSPSAGEFTGASDMERVVRGYEAAGAAALSILTDSHSFGGCLEDLGHARSITGLPILQKDFIIDAEQLVEARAYGADAILLIAAVLQTDEVTRLISAAHSLSLEVLLELHTVEELERMNQSVDVVGVNNRDLKTLQIDVARSFELAEYLPRESIRISESGLRTPEIVRELHSAGYSGFLMGERFLQEEEPGLACASFLKDFGGTR